jgi:hypothetical protein
MRQTYRVVSNLIAIGVLLQAAAVAFGWFQVLSDVENGLVYSDDNAYNAGHIVHSIVGMVVMPLMGLVLLGVSFGAARQVPKARAMAGIVLGLIVLQVALAFVAFGVPVIGALHGLNALILLGAALRAASLARTPAPVEGQRPGSPETSGSTLPV